MLIALCRLGRDGSLKETAAGKPVLNLTLAYNYGREKETQWLDVSMFGERAAKVAQYMTKGASIVAYIDDVHVRTYPKKDGTTGASLSGVLSSFEFAGKSGGASSEPTEVAQPKPAMAPVQDLESDIPF